MGEEREKLVLGEPLMWNINVRKLMECHSDTPFFCPGTAAISQ